MSEVGELSVKVTADTSALKRKISGDAEAQGKSFASKMAKGLGGLAVAGVAVGTAAAGGLAVIGKASLDAASDLNETQSKIEAIFGAESAAKLEAWSDTAASAFGQSKAAALDASGTFAVFGKAAGLMGSDLEEFAMANTELSSDLASFFNTEPAEAAQAIAAALRGESEPIRKYGVMINDAALKQAYFEMTGEKVSGTLTAQQKALAANQLIWEQTADAQGDYERTSDGLANSQRSLAATLEDVKGKVGQGLLPAITEIVQALGPLATELAEPLGELAAMIGEQLADAFEVIGPLLKPLSEALISLGGSVLGALIGAVKTLIPALTPLLQAFQTIGARLGPLLERVMGKVAEVLAKVLEAVVPLLEPLMDLVFTILDAAWPIIEIVADVLLVLVDALKPVLGAVVALLKPLAQLISAGLGALMPVIQPLLPIITLLAEILGDVLVRAIGVLMGGIGLLIKAWAKAGAFIVDKFIDPVMDAFFTFVGSMVEGAAEAFGWVPGLGDKLKDASKNFDSWAEGTKTSIKGAAKTAVEEADKIADGLIDSSKEMVVQGSQGMKDAGVSLGEAAADGMAIGIRNGQIPVQAASRDLANSAITGAKNTLESNSPSRVFIRIGGDVVEGFEIGLKNMDKIPDKIKGPLEKAIKVSNDRLDKLVSDARKKLDEAINVWEDYRAGVLGAVTGNVNFVDAMRQTQEQEARVIAAQEALNEARAAAANGGPDDMVQRAADELAAAQAAVKTYEGNLNAMVDQSEFFGTMFDKATDAMIAQFGTDSPIWGMMRQQMLAAGPVEGAALAQYIAENGLSPEMEQRLLGWNAWAGQVAKDQADKNHAQGVTMAKDAMLGIEDKVKEEEKRIKKIGKAIGDGVVVGFKSKQGAFKDAVDGYINAAFARLEIRSPSKVFQYAGEMVGEGFALGVDKTMPQFAYGAGLNRIYSPGVGDGGGASVRVFIGDRELTDIVRTEVGHNNNDLARSLTFGRR